MSYIYKKKQGQRSYNHIIFQHSPLAYNALCPSPHNLLYDLRIKGFGLTDKPHMHRYIQLLVRGKPTAS